MLLPWRTTRPVTSTSSVKTKPSSSSPPSPPPPPPIKEMMLHAPGVAKATLSSSMLAAKHRPVKAWAVAIPSPPCCASLTASSNAPTAPAFLPGRAAAVDDDDDDAGGGGTAAAPLLLATMAGGGGGAAAAFASSPGPPTALGMATIGACSDEEAEVLARFPPWSISVAARTATPNSPTTSTPPVHHHHVRNLGRGRGGGSSHRSDGDDDGGDGGAPFVGGGACSSWGARAAAGTMPVPPSMTGPQSGGGIPSCVHGCVGGMGWGLGGGGGARASGEAVCSRFALVQLSGAPGEGKEKGLCKHFFGKLARVSPTGTEPY